MENVGMNRCCTLVIWILTIQICIADQNGSVKAFLERAPARINGHNVRIAIESFDYNKGTGAKAFVCVNVEIPLSAPRMRSSEMKVIILDSNGQNVATELADKFLARSENRQEVTFKIKLQDGQKIETVRVRWGDSEKTFSYSRGEISDIYMF
jgi:hypothetical protein